MQILILEVFCTKGGLKVELDEERTNGQLFIFVKMKILIKWPGILLECPKTPSNYQNFIKSIQNNKNLQPDFNQGAKIQKIIDSCIKSNDNNSWIDINK